MGREALKVKRRVREKSCFLRDRLIVHSYQTEQSKYAKNIITMAQLDNMCSVTTTINTITTTIITTDNER
ncbi:hypothetical protein E2C01_047837 [Portunus trituberculatus]|uniref:Uncharacterized protein n=1 Tax=Portunus trituberculatus TaxID=210409 RepID=A0A5B7GBL3_PORTR|nr:hypothetical protein [Portunus trituberculatus]